MNTIETTEKPSVKLEGKLLKNGTDYTVSYSANKNAGTAKVIVKGTGNFTGSITRTFKIRKATNPLALKGKTVVVTYKKLKTKSRTIPASSALTVKKKGKGTMTFKLSTATRNGKSYKNYFAINAKTGRVTVKKALKKGTYRVRVKVRAAGNANYKASAFKSVTIIVKVR